MHYDRSPPVCQALRSGFRDHQRYGCLPVFAIDAKPSRCFGLLARSGTPLFTIPQPSFIRSKAETKGRSAPSLAPDSSRGARTGRRSPSSTKRAINSLSFTPSMAARALARRNRPSGMSTVVRISAFKRFHLYQSIASWVRRASRHLAPVQRSSTLRPKSRANGTAIWLWPMRETD